MMENRSKEWEQLSVEERMRYCHMLAKRLADRLDVKSFTCDVYRYALSLSKEHEVLKEGREELAEEEKIEALIKEKDLEKVKKKEEELREQRVAKEREEQYRREEARRLREKRREEARRGYRELKGNIRFCKKSRREIAGYIRDWNRGYEKGAKSKKEYLSYINGKINGKNRLEWIDFCNRYIEENEKDVNRYKKEFEGNVRPLLPISAVLVLAVMFTFLVFRATTIGLGPALPTEFLIVRESYNFSDEVDLSFNENGGYVWVMENYGELKSVRLDGSVSKGIVKKLV